MKSTISPKTQRFLSDDDLRKRGIRYSRVQLWRMVKAVAFPRPVQLSKARSAWRETDVEAWMSSRSLSGDVAQETPAALELEKLA